MAFQKNFPSLGVNFGWGYKGDNKTITVLTVDSHLFSSEPVAREQQTKFEDMVAEQEGNSNRP